MPIDVAQGHLYGTVFEAALYGIYLILFFLAVFVFHTWHDKTRRSSKVIIGAIIFMFCLSTAHLAGTIRSIQAGFFDSRPAPPELYFNSKAVPLNLVNKSLYGTNMLVGDAVMLYRLYIVAQGSLYYIVPPLLTLIGTGVIGYVTIWEFSQLKAGQSAFAEAIQHLAPALFILPLVTNVLITSLIIFKILQAQHRVRDMENPEVASRYRRVIANTVESGILYPGLLLVTVVLYMKNSNGQDILTGPMTQIISIVPTLMWLQVRLGFSQYDEATRRARSGAIPSLTPGQLVFMHTEVGRETRASELLNPNAKEGNLVETSTKIMLQHSPAPSTASIV